MGIDTKTKKTATETDKTGTDYSFIADQAFGPAYGTDPRLSYQYYARTKTPLRQKATGQVATISIAGALAERAVRASSMFDPALDYARRELEEAAQVEASATPKVSAEKKYAIKTGALAPARVEAQEIKSEAGALMASRGGATVKDLLAAREVGVGKLATAGLEAESQIAKLELEEWQKHDKTVKDAEKRQDEMQQALFDARQEQRGYTADLIRDVAHVTATYAAHHPAGQDQPMIDKMVEEGVPWPEIEKMHAAAVKARFYPGTRGYEQYLMANYEGMPTDADPGKPPKTPELAGAPPMTPAGGVDPQAVADAGGVPPGGTVSYGQAVAQGATAQPSRQAPPEGSIEMSNIPAIQNHIKRSGGNPDDYDYYVTAAGVPIKYAAVRRGVNPPPGYRPAMVGGRMPPGPPSEWAGN